MKIMSILLFLPRLPVFREHGIGFSGMSFLGHFQAANVRCAISRGQASCCLGPEASRNNKESSQPEFGINCFFIAHKEFKR